MPVSFSGTLSHEFRYTTVDALRAQGLDEERIPDDRANELIVLCSNWINSLTQQWFLPIRTIEKTDGRGSAIAHHRLMLPILDLFEVRIGKQGLFETKLTEMSYQVKPRYVQMLSQNTMLPKPPLFVILDGVFGWLEEDFWVARTKVTQDVNIGDEIIHLDSVKGINPNDVVLVGRNPFPESGAVIVKAIHEPGRIAVEPVRFSCFAGSPAVRYGRVPRMIEYATMLLVRDRAMKLGLRGTEDDSDSPRWFAERLQSESVEGYSYNLSALPTSYGFAGGGYTTGNPEVDDILQQYSCPLLYLGTLA